MFLIAAGAVVLLLVGATAGLALSGRFGNSAPATPDTSSVDAGFARDMIVHHDQGVLMAHYAEENTTDPEISVMAYDSATPRPIRSARCRAGCRSGTCRNPPMART